MSLSRYLREPRGAKSIEHLESLRQTAERQWTDRGPAAGWLKAELFDLQLDRPTSTGLTSSHVSAPGHELEGGNDNLQHHDGGEDEATSTSTADSWQVLKPTGPRLPRILSNQLLDTLHGDDDLALGEAADFSLASRFGRFDRQTSCSTSFDSDELEDESIRSAALTAHERTSRLSERASNETISSFLDDASDGAFSSFGSLPATPRSPVRTGERGSGWAPPRGIFKDAEMAAKVAAKAKAFESEEIRVAAPYKATGFHLPKQTLSKETNMAGGKAVNKANDKDPLGKAALRHLV
jgi:hypothetical protein